MLCNKITRMKYCKKITKELQKNMRFLNIFAELKKSQKYF